MNNQVVVMVSENIEGSVESAEKRLTDLLNDGYQLLQSTNIGNGNVIFSFMLIPQAVEGEEEDQVLTGEVAELLEGVEK